MSFSVGRSLFSKMGFGRNQFHACLALVCAMSLAVVSSTPISPSELNLLVVRCANQEPSKCQDLERADMSGITSLDTLFEGVSLPDVDLSRWNTGRVTNMRRVFSRINFDPGDISRWDTSKVVRFDHMFQQTQFNRGLSRWNTSSATNMQEMFSRTQIFNGDISRWDTSKVSNMYRMFEGSSRFNSDISRWDTGEVVNMQCIFCGAQLFNSDISRWNTGKVQNMGQMFSRAFDFDADISRWDVSSVTSMTGMFEEFRRCVYIDFPPGCDPDSYYAYFWGGVECEKDCEPMTADLSKWDTSRVTGMERMFVDSGFEGDLCPWNIEARYKSIRGSLELVVNGALFGCHDSCKDDTKNQDTEEAYVDCGGTLNCRGGCLPACEESREWETLGALEQVDEMRTGGLGKLMDSDGIWKVWMCLFNTTCAQSVGPFEPPVEARPDFAGSDAVWGTGDDEDWADWMCYKFNEKQYVFELWGLNSDLKLFPPAALPGANLTM